jgi:hypothetical protein
MRKSPAVPEGEARPVLQAVAASDRDSTANLDLLKAYVIARRSRVSLAHARVVADLAFKAVRS